MVSIWFRTRLLFAGLLLVGCFQAVPGESECAIVSQQECSNGTLSDALSSITSNSSVQLAPGTHYLSNLTIVHNVSNVSVYGMAQNPQDTVIVCSDGVGMVFVGCSSVTLRRITVNNCGLKGENLNSAIDLLDQSTYFLFDVPQTLSISLFIGNSEDVELQKVIIRDTQGLGLLAMNALGNFVIEDSSFFGNVPDGCFFVSTTDMNVGVGGGAILIYQETSSPPPSMGISTLNVTNTTFVNNSNCGASSVYLLYSEFQASFLQDYNASYGLSGGGGLTLLLSMYRYTLNVYIDQAVFKNNTAQVGSGMCVGLFTAVSNASITVHNSTFDSNGIDTDVDLTSPSFIVFGAAVTVLKDILYLRSTPYLDSVEKSGPNLLTFSNNQFVGNSGYAAGALYVHSLYSQVANGNNDRIVLRSCLFEGNQAYIGAAAEFFEMKYSGIQDGLEIEIQDTTFNSNQLISFAAGSSTFGNLGTSALSSGIIDTVAMKLTLSGKNVFLNNSGTGIHTVASILEFDGEATFEKNAGSYGGGLGITESSIVLIRNNSDVRFMNNSAFIAGGGIYTVYYSAGLYYFDCFLFFDTIDFNCDLYMGCLNPASLNVTIVFDGNESPLGSIVYGSTLETCAWVTSLDITEGTNVFQYLKSIGILKYESNEEGNSFNTLPYQLELRQSSNEAVMPGQVANISLSAHDRFNQTVPDPVTSTVVDGFVRGTFEAILGASGYWFINQDTNGSIVPVTFMSLADVSPEEEIVTIAVYSVGSSAAHAVNFTLHQCYPGFVFPNTSSGKYNTCVCDQVLLNDRHVECNSTSAEITVYAGQWVGSVEENGTLLAVVSCPFDYCKSGVKTVTNGNFDSQCSTDFSRTGIACGHCVTNYSIVIGSNRCLSCSNLSLFLLLVFGFCGVVVLYIITRTNLTISTGYFSSLVFYSNMMALYQPYFLPNVQFYALLSPILFWNLDIGFETCFYDGMTPLQKAYLRFVFPIYLWIVMAVYVALGHWNIGRIRQNAPSAIASLLLLCYVSTLESCISALSFLSVDGVGIRWRIDPSIDYFQGNHLPLGVFSIAVILIYIVPFPILISVPALTLRTPIGKRFLPICDAFWAAYNPKFHFWEGIRMILRITIFLSTFLLPSPLNVLILGVACVALILLTAICLPYRKRSANIFEIFLLLDLVLIVQGVLYFASALSISEQADTEEVNYQLVIFTCICLIPVYVLLVALKIYYILKTYPKVVLVLLKPFRTLLKKNHTIPVETAVSKKNDNHEIELSTHPKVLSYTDLREPLLDDPEASDRPLSIVHSD